jgi:hypothetical protein
MMHSSFPWRSTAARFALVTGLAMTASALAGEAQACACCAEEGQRNVGSEPFDSGRRAELERVNFAPAAKLFGAGREPEPDLMAMADAYTIKASWADGRLVFNLSEAGGGSGTISLKVPEKIAIFEVDQREAPDSGLGPALYKEWKLTGTVEATGAFKAAAAGDQRLTLILQGRGNSCGSAEDFKTWVLVMEGKAANFTLFGDLTAPD